LGSSLTIPLDQINPAESLKTAAYVASLPTESNVIPLHRTA